MATTDLTPADSTSAAAPAKNDRAVAAPTASDPRPRMDPAGQRVVWLLLGAAFVAILNETTMSIAIPHLVDDLDITTNAAQWITTSFMLTMAVVIPISGFLLQRFTTRAMYIAAMTLFSAGTLIALVAPGFPVLVAARVVQASGTAIMMPLLMTTIMTVVPPQLRGRMMGRVTVVISLAPAIGPTLSGLLLDSVGWRGIFAVILPIALVALVTGALWVRSIGTRTNAPIDVVSVVLSALGFGGLVYGLSQIGGGEAGGSPAAMVVALVVGAVGLALFAWRQLVLQRRDGALLDLRVFRSQNFTLSILQMTLLSAGFFGAITLLPIYLQDVHGLSSTEAGLVVLPGALVMGLSGPIVGRIYDRYGTVVLLVPGAIVVNATLWLFTIFDADTPVWLIVVSQITLSLGLSLSFTPLFTASLGSLTPRFYSYGSALVSTAQQVAGAAGIAVLITTMTAVLSSVADAGGSATTAGAAGTQAAFLVAALIAAPTLVGAFLVRKPADDLAESPAPVH